MINMIMIKELKIDGVKKKYTIDTYVTYMA